ncbi:hypothetical protein COLO4_05393 [Corchorus olitorius]|uniref:Uncharacterized protein n=1 Tax=Corchorus olitorius TaxID=93759 RepID=A0A1R3KR27_9ROSI|nr:hypothetical protein COLO4_05393 [Corchorus olitorius]
MEDASIFLINSFDGEAEKASNAFESNKTVAGDFTTAISSVSPV